MAYPRPDRAVVQAYSAEKILAGMIQERRPLAGGFGMSQCEGGSVADGFWAAAASRAAMWAMR